MLQVPHISGKLNQVSVTLRITLSLTIHIGSTGQNK